MNVLQILVTGGTLDKAYHELTGELYFPETHLPQMLKEARLTRTFDLKVLMQKDSLEMTLADREMTLQACIDSPSEQILITHGTDTMGETADFLSQHRAALTDKTIVLTGAMRPYSFGRSDALFNLGTACGFLAQDNQTKGIFIAMNGQIFEAGKVQKNRQKGIFERPLPSRTGDSEHFSR